MLLLWICTVLTWPRGALEPPCWAVFFLEIYVVAYICEFELSRLRPWGVQSNLLSCTSVERIAEWTPMCLHYSLNSWRKSEQVFPRDNFRLRDSFKCFFHSYNTPFLSCKYQHLGLLMTYQFHLINEWSSFFLFCFFFVFSIQFVSLLLDSFFFTGR